MAVSSVSGANNVAQTTMQSDAQQVQQNDAQVQDRAIQDQQRQDTKVQNNIDERTKQTNAQKTGVGNSVNLTA